MIDRRADVTGLDLINQVISDPGVLWRKYFYTTMGRLDDDQKEVLLNWFFQMTKVRSESKWFFNWVFVCSCKRCTSARSRKQTISWSFSFAKSLSHFTLMTRRSKSSSRRFKIWRTSPTSTVSWLNLTASSTPPLQLPKSWGDSLNHAPKPCKRQIVTKNKSKRSGLPTRPRS